MAKTTPPNPLVNAYLFLYNMAHAAGWAYIGTVAVATLSEWVTTGNDAVVGECWTTCGWALRLFQTVALLEIVHAMTIVRSNPVMAFAQVGARNLHVWFMIATTPSFTGSYLFPVLMLIWSAADTPRYLLYGAKIAGMGESFVGQAIAGVRYTAFLVLYPVGLVTELMLHHRFRVQRSGGYTVGETPSPVVNTARSMASMLALPTRVPTGVNDPETAVILAWIYSSLVVYFFFPLFFFMLKQRASFLKARRGEVDAKKAK